MGLDPQLETGVTHHRAGRLREAEEVYRRIIAEKPNYADALHLLGLVQFQQRLHDPAIELIRKAIALNPTAADYYDNLGQIYAARNRIDDAWRAIGRRRR